MSRKISLFSGKMMLFQIGIALTCAYIFLVDNNLLMSIIVLLFFIHLLIFLNSIDLFNLERSILTKLNFKNKIIKPQVFLWNLSLYIILFFILFLLSMKNPIFLNCLFTVFIYQLIDIILLYKKSPIIYFFISFSIFFGINALFYCQNLAKII